MNKYTDITVASYIHYVSATKIVYSILHSLSNTVLLFQLVNVHKDVTLDNPHNYHNTTAKKA